MKDEYEEYSENASLPIRERKPFKTYPDTRLPDVAWLRSLGFHAAKQSHGDDELEKFGKRTFWMVEWPIFASLRGGKCSMWHFFEGGDSWHRALGFVHEDTRRAEIVSRLVHTIALATQPCSKEQRDGYFQRARRAEKEVEEIHSRIEMYFGRLGLWLYNSGAEDLCDGSR